jgi:predicted 2-oxoglutarate/Fe(II)-dependent dioxygenase YbiX
MPTTTFGRKSMNLPYVKESFLNKEACATLVLLLRRYAKKGAHTQPSVSTEKRLEVAATSVFPHGRPAEARLLARIRASCKAEIETHFAPIRPIYPMTMVLRGSYPGDCHEQHADNCRYDESVHKWLPNDTPHRAISCVIYLNDCETDFTGGEMVFSAVNKVISARAGLFVAFSSGERFEHEVRPVRSGVRYSIMLWFTEKPEFEEDLPVPKLEYQKVEDGAHRKLILRNHLAPGDVLMLTAAVRDLHLSHPGRFITDHSPSFGSLIHI